MLAAACLCAAGGARACQCWRVCAAGPGAPLCTAGVRVTWATCTQRSSARRRDTSGADPPPAGAATLGCTKDAWRGAGCFCSQPVLGTGTCLHFCLGTLMPSFAGALLLGHPYALLHFCLGTLMPSFAGALLLGHPHALLLGHPHALLHFCLGTIVPGFAGALTCWPTWKMTGCTPRLPAENTR